MEKIEKIIKKSIDVQQKLLENKSLLVVINDICNEMVKAFKNNNKVLLCGNGGSASDAQHIAAELSGKFYIDRAPLFAEALHVNTSYITAVANDYSFSEIFARLVRAKGQKGDILIGISTSGNSENVIKALEEANELDMITIGFTNNTGGSLKGLVKFLLNVPSDDTPRIQESHIMVGHVICELVEKKLFG